SRLASLFIRYLCSLLLLLTLPPPTSTLFPYTTLFRSIENGRSWLFSTKMGVVWPLIIDQTLIHLTPHMFPCHRSHSWISGKETRSEEHTSELQSRFDLVCRLLLEKKKISTRNTSQLNM